MGRGGNGGNIVCEYGDTVKTGCVLCVCICRIDGDVCDGTRGGNGGCNGCESGDTAKTG